MLVTFKSKAAADVIMYEKHAQPILDMLGKEIKRGVITADESAHAVALLEEEFARSRDESAAEDAQREAEANEDDDEDEVPAGQNVPLATRIFPLLEMLRAAHRDQQFVTWGV